MISPVTEHSHCLQSMEGFWHFWAHKGPWEGEARLWGVRLFRPLQTHQRRSFRQKNKPKRIGSSRQSCGRENIDFGRRGGVPDKGEREKELVPNKNTRCWGCILLMQAWKNKHSAARQRRPEPSRESYHRIREHRSCDELPAGQTQSAGEGGVREVTIGYRQPTRNKSCRFSPVLYRGNLKHTQLLWGRQASSLSLSHTGLLQVTHLTFSMHFSFTLLHQY